MICRLILLTVLLGSGLIIGSLLEQALAGADWYYLLIGAGYALTVLYALLQPLWSSHPLAAYVQVTGDIALITGFVYVTGGVTSPFSLLYFLSVIAAGIMLGRAGAMSSAAGAWVMYSSLILLIVYGWIPAPATGGIWDVVSAAGSAWDVASGTVDKRVAYSLFSHFLGFFSVAQLSAYLTGKLESAGEQLQENKEALAQAQALNRDIIDSITSGIITTDLSGRITFMNRGAEEITGRRLSVVHSSDIGPFLGMAEAFLERLRDNVEKGRRYRFEVSLPGPGGSPLFLGLSSAILRGPREEPRGYIFSFQDLTEIKALEEEVRLKDRMAALGQMAAGIAHEIRNPLASMSGSVQILKKSLRPSVEEGELLDIVLRESKRLDGIIRDFLLFARPGRFDPEVADLGVLVRESMTLLRNSDEFSNHQIVMGEAPGPIHARVDVNMMKQVFWNLAKNALRAMPGGGTLRLGLGREQPSSVVVSFIDQGIGMTESEVRRAFEPFQGKFSDGTGLGLAVVFRIVQEHQGRIQVNSDVGKGTEILLILPEAQEGEIPLRPDAAAVAAAS